MKEIKKLNPFGRFCCTIGNLPSSYMLSLTYEEQLLWFCNYLENTVIPAINNNAEALEEVQRLFVELKEYVENYLDNLDLQEDINNKLNSENQSLIKMKESYDFSLSNSNGQIINEINFQHFYLALIHPQFFHPI